MSALFFEDPFQGDDLGPCLDENSLTQPKSRRFHASTAHRAMTSSPHDASHKPSDTESKEQKGLEQRLSRGATLQRLVNDRLKTIGLLDHDLNFKGNVDSEILDVLQALLDQRSDSKNQLEDARSRMRRISADSERIATDNKRLKAKCLMLEREIEASNVRLSSEKREHMKRVKICEEKHAVLEKQNKLLKSRDAAYEAKLCQCEVDCNKLRMRMRKLLSKNVTASRKPGICMSKPGILRSNSAVKNSQSVADLTIIQLEEQLKTLRAENIELREIIVDFEDEVNFFEGNVHRLECRRGINSSYQYKENSNAALHIPLDWIQHSVITNVQKKILQLRQRIASLEKLDDIQTTCISGELVESQLAKRYEMAKSIILEQDMLIKQNMLQRRRARKIVKQRRHLQNPNDQNVAMCIRRPTSSEAVPSGHMLLHPLVTPHARVDIVSVEVLAQEQEIIEQEKNWLENERKHLKQIKINRKPALKRCSF